MILKVALRLAGSIGAAVLAAYGQFTPAPNGPFFSGHNPVSIVAFTLRATETVPCLAVVNQGDGNITVLLGDGKGNFAAAATGPNGNGTFPVGGSPSSIASGDFNGDGNTDLAIANAGDNTVTILLGDGAGTFKIPPGQKTVPATGRSPSSIAVADFDGDSHLDIATANLLDGTVTILYGDGTGTVSTRQLPPLPAGKFPISLIAADLNADGIPDLAAANQGDGTVSVWINPAKNATPLSLSSLVVPKSPLTQTISAVAAGNLFGHSKNSNGLAYLDLAVTYYNNTTLQGNLVLFVADEHSGYVPPPASFFPNQIGLQPIAIATGAFDAGLNPGVAIVNYRSNTAALYAGDSMGDLTAAVNGPYATGALPRALAVADFNGDGLSDVAVANYFDGTVTVLLDALTAPATMVSAASNTPQVAPGSLVTIYGTALVSSAVPGGTTITLTDASGAANPLMLSYAGSTQLNTQIPPSAATGPASFVVKVPGQNPRKGTVTILPVAPELFSANESGQGTAQAFVVNLVNPSSGSATFTCNSSDVCALNSFDVSQGGVVLGLYATGIPSPSPSPVTATVGGVSVPVLYAGPEPGASGVNQVNLSLPATLAHYGTVYVQLSAGGVMSNQVTVAIK